MKAKTKTHEIIGVFMSQYGYRGQANALKALGLNKPISFLSTKEAYEIISARIENFERVKRKRITRAEISRAAGESVKKRICLGCDRQFLSVSTINRLCLKCKTME